MTSLPLVFAAGDGAARTVRVRALDDAVVQGGHAGAITATVSSADVWSGTVGTPTVDAAGRNDALSSTGAFGTRNLKGYLVRLVSGAGAGQVRRIWSNTADTLTVEGDWDTLPAVGDQYVVTGYVAPVTDGVVGGQVTAISGDARTITLDTATLPTANGGLTGALVRIVDGTGAGQYRVVASNTASQITTMDAWSVVGDRALAVGTRVGVVELTGVTVPRPASGSATTTRPVSGSPSPVATPASSRAPRPRPHRHLHAAAHAGTDRQ